MVKKILICLSICLLLLVGLGVYALDITDDEDFKEVTTDTSFMLNSPLFTQKEDGRKYVQREYDMEADGFEKVLENDKFEFYHSESKAYSIRVVNKGESNMNDVSVVTSSNSSSSVMSNA